MTEGQGWLVVLVVSLIGLMGALELENGYMLVAFSAPVGVSLGWLAGAAIDWVVWR